MIMKDGALLFDVLHTLIDSPPLLAQIHDRSDVFRRHHDLCLHHRLFHIIDLRRIRHISRVGQVDHLSVRLMDLIDNARRRCDKVEIVLSLQSLLDDLQMEESEESTAEPESQRDRSLCLKLKRRVVELQLLQGIPQIRILCTVGRIESAVDHRVDLFISRQRLCARMLSVRDRISDAGLLDIFQARGNIPDHSCTQFIAGDELTGAKGTDLHDLGFRSCSHHEHRRALFHCSLFDPAEYDDALIGVIFGIKDQRLERRVRVACRRRDLLHDLLEDLMDILSCLCRDQRRVLRVEPDHILDLFLHSVRIRARQIDLVDDRHDIQIVIQGKINIRQSLRLHALSRVHNKDRSVARRQTPGHLIVEVYMSRGIDQVEDIFLTIVRLVDSPHCLCLDRDPSLTLQIHIVQDLSLHLPARQQSRHLDDAVRQSGFPVINMCNDAKISDFFLIYYCHFSSSNIYALPEYFTIKSSTARLSVRSPVFTLCSISAPSSMTALSSCIRNRFACSIYFPAAKGWSPALDAISFLPYPCFKSAFTWNRIRYCRIMRKRILMGGSFSAIRS